jgi:ABC-2 type transport system permease protein/ribosome-dependent ATPase
MMFVLMITPPFLTALGVVREKENGSIYNIYASTVTRGEFLLGKLAPYVGISVINILILWLMATMLFGAPFKGDPLFFFIASVIYVICTTGIGLLVPIASMNKQAQFEAHLFPAMYYTDIALGSFLKGVGLEQLWGKVLALAIYAVVLWMLSYLLFHKRPRS